MKYNININQIKILEIAPDIDIKEATILDYLITICNSKNSKIAQKRQWGFTWINYSKLISDLPLLKIKSKWAISPKIQNLELYWFIKIKTINQDVFVELTDLVDNLSIEWTAIHKNEQYCSQKWTDNCSQIWTNNNTNINTYNKDNNIISNDIIEAEASSITKPKEIYWNEEINSLLQIIKNNNDWLCAGTVQEQRRYWKMLLGKLKQFTKSWYDPLESLDVLLQKLDWNQFYWPKKVWPKDIYYNFEKLIQVVKLEIQKEKKEEKQMQRF